MNELPKSRDYCLMALNLCHRSLSELIVIAEQKEKDNNSICDSDTIRFYQFTLHYMFILEICKLMENNFRNNKENYASLNRLNLQLLSFFGDDYKSIFDKVNKELDALLKSALFKKIKLLRHEKLAHSDRDQEHGPLHFKGFSKDELQKYEVFLEEISNLFNLCIRAYEQEIHFPKQFTTLGFLTNYENYRRYAFHDFRNFMVWKTMSDSENK